MRTCYLFFSHSLAEEQKSELLEDFQVNKFVSLPEYLQKIWSQVPTAKQEKEYRTVGKEIYNYLKENVKEGDVLLIQGDPGMSYAVASWANFENVIPIYATTERVATEIKKPDGSVELKHIFKHAGFREYTDFMTFYEVEDV